MAITIGTNIPSYTTRVNLNSVTDKLSDTMERLSSGLRINKAGDDSAGLVISENMEAVIRASEQAVNNIQTASSFLTVAEDGMVSISEHYQRINDLLENMANDTNDITSRTAAVEEIIERLDEINRLADTTDFNGRKMLDGSIESIIVQMGTDSTELSTLDISPALDDCHTAGMNTTLSPELYPDARKAADSSIVAIKQDKTGNFVDLDGNIILQKDDDGDWADADGNKIFTFGSNNETKWTDKSSGTPTDVYTYDDGDKEWKKGTDVIYSVNADGNWEDADGNIVFKKDTATNNWVDKDGNIVLEKRDDGYYVPNSPTKVNNTDVDAYITSLVGQTFEEGLINGYLDKTYGKAGSGYEPTNENCRKYMAKVQAAISDIAAKRGLIGAYENRMQSSFDSLSNRIESLKTAKMVYTDVDIAKTSTDMVTQQIMQQINISVLGSANSMQQTALALLGG